VPRRKSGALGSAKMVTKFEWIVVVQADEELSSILPPLPIFPLLISELQIGREA